MRLRSFLAYVAAFAVAFSLMTPASGAGKKKKKKEDEEPVTQTLPVLKDPPLAVVAETDRLSFRTAPLTNKGLLSAQVRDSLKFLLKENKGNIVKLRAFVAGTGDMRRFGTIVSELFTEKKVPLPALTTVQVGALPMEGAQVVIEAIVSEKKAVNPQGVALLPALPVDQIQATIGTLGLGGNRVARATCYLPSIETVQKAREQVAAAFPGAVVNMVQMQRLPVAGPMVCETVATLEKAPSKAAESREGGKAMLLAPGKVLITGTQMAFHSADSDVKLAFDRLGRTLEANQASYSNVVAAWIYPLAEDVALKVRGKQGDYLPKERAPIISTVPMEGLPSIDASFAVEVMALVN